MIQSHHQSSPRRAAGVVLIGATVVAMSWAACSDEQRPTPDAWTMRDALGLSPSWYLELDDADRASWRDTFTSTAQDQADDASWVALGDLPAAQFRQVVSQLDGRRADNDEDPILVQWVVTEHDGPVARACPVRAEDFDAIDEADESQWSAGWSVADEFVRADLDGQPEDEIVREHLPRLERLLERCATAAGDAAPDGAATEILVERAEGAPALLTWFTESRRLYVNPLVLAIWEAERAPTQSPALANNDLDSRASPLSSSNVWSCINRTRSDCLGCDREGAPCGGTTASAAVCSAIEGLPNGPERYCINLQNYSWGRDLRFCVIEEAPACSFGQPVKRIGDLGHRYINTSAEARCLDVIDACVRDISRVDNTPYYPPPEEEPVYTGGSGVSDSNCNATCEDEGGGCDDSDSDTTSSSDSGGCEGDTADDGGGCEGDSADSGGGCEGDTAGGDTGGGCDSGGGSTCE